MEKMDFSLHPKLAEDCIFLLDWPCCKVLLMNDSQYPWLILVPRLANVSELFQLSMAEQQAVLHELNAVCLALQHCRPTKLNVAALGNIVPQLHIHIVARFNTDTAWPKPIWGVSPAQPYKVEDLESIKAQYLHWLNHAYSPS
jgi:diadenosine tetraphosphate (Ap4A) HIT family hydrolase